MWKSFARLTCVAVSCMAACSSSLATGIYFMPRWLDQGGVASDHSPEFYWELEVRKLAEDFKPSQERVTRPLKDGVEVSYAEQTSATDLADFEKTKPTPEALAKHHAALDAIVAANETTTTPLPEEPPSEFADYHRGAFAFRLGQKHWNDAALAWEALLKRPENERRHRSVWAAFMLGKLALFAQKPEAVEWFRMTRDLAKQGFSDSLGLAADSYGWEAKSELEQGNVERAAQLYLTQLALGDDSAIVSLKALVPDREAVYGMMNFSPEPENADEALLNKLKAERDSKVPGELERAARDPLLRRIVTAHVLATETVASSYAYFTTADPQGARCQRWLAAVQKAKVGEVQDAAKLGWVAYTAGNYKDAQRWLNLDAGTSDAALWLKAKLLRRNGQLKEATAAMSQAWKSIREESVKSTTPTESASPFSMGSDGALDPLQSAGGDLGALHLSRGDFVSAYEAFLDSKMPEDAALVAERVLTADELKKVVDARFPGSAELDKESDDNYDVSYWGNKSIAIQQRWLLGRRLVREDRYQEARGYLPPKYREVLDHYTQALDDGANEKLAKAKRARAWFDAALIARFNGMELMGTEVEPDNFMAGGEFEASDVATDREAGTTQVVRYQDGNEVKTTMKLSVPTTEEERRRLAKHKPSPNKRFHYRYIAAALGWKAALLLPDNSDELADVLNSSGRWIKGDSKAADKYFQAIERRASKTATGKEAGAKHWFVERYGPWTEAPKEQ
ncbi:MAG: hypothetical protein JNM99_05705 [Verrucomicrobiaceae bacterium]|nr:hypothetical protein [Verrucomicrobiaceae bacterium]